MFWAFPIGFFCDICLQYLYRCCVDRKIAIFGYLDLYGGLIPCIPPHPCVIVAVVTATGACTASVNKRYCYLFARPKFSPAFQLLITDECVWAPGRDPYLAVTVALAQGVLLKVVGDWCTLVALTAQLIVTIVHRARQGQGVGWAHTAPGLAQRVQKYLGVLVALLHYTVQYIILWVGVILFTLLM